MALVDLTTSISNYTQAIKDYLRSNLGIALVSEQVTLSGNGTKDYDVAALIGADSANYDLLSARVEVKVLDDETTSPTHNLYINSEGVITVGANATGTVRLHNYRTSSVTCHVRIDVPRLT